MGTVRLSRESFSVCLGFGIYHSKDEFLQKSLSVVHPFDSMCPLKDELLKVLFNIATWGLCGWWNKGKQHCRSG